VFVLDALSKQARAVADVPPESFEGEGWGWVNPQAWQGVAREIAGKLDAQNLARHQRPKNHSEGEKKC
jgi:hypothetical protein